MRAGWKKAKLRDVCKIDKTKHQGDSLPYVGLEHIESSTGHFSGSLHPIEVRSSTFRFGPEHILYGRLRPYLNKVFLPGFKGHCSSEIFPIKVNTGIEKRYLYYWITSQKVVDEINETCTGTRMPRANLKEVMTFDFPVPPLPEQKRIVAILDEAFAGLETAVANTEKNLANARELFDGYLNSVFTQQVADWGRKKLEDLCERITKGSSPKWQGIEYVDEPGILFITSENVGLNRMVFKKTKYVEEAFNKKDAKSILKKGDVLTNIVGASIGRTAIFDRGDLANINQAVCLLRCNPEKLNNQFLSYLLNSPFFRQILHDNEINNARANLSLGFFKSLQIPLPPVATQEAIVSSVDAIELETQNLETIYQQKLTALTELKQSLLQKAFSGELTAKKAENRMSKAAA